MSKSQLIYLIRISIVIILITLFLDRLIYYGISYMRDQVYSGQAVGKFNYFNKIKNEKDVLFLGSSRTSRHFDVNRIASNSFNIGMDGTKLAYSATIFQSLPKNKKQTIIYQIDPEYAIDSTYNGSDVKALLPFYHENSVIRESFKKLKINNPFIHVLYSGLYNGKVLGIIFNFKKKNNEFEELNGYQPNFIDENQQKNLKIEIQKELQNKIDCKKYYSINLIYRSFLSDIKNFAEENHKKVIFVTTPRYHDFCQGDNVALKKIMDSLKLTYIDDTNYFGDNSSFEYWKDSGHMSDKGAKEYSKRIKNIVDSIH